MDKQQLHERTFQLKSKDDNIEMHDIQVKVHVQQLSMSDKVIVLFQVLDNDKQATENKYDYHRLYFNKVNLDSSTVYQMPLNEIVQAG